MFRAESGQRRHCGEEGLDLALDSNVNAFPRSASPAKNLRNYFLPLSSADIRCQGKVTKRLLKRNTCKRVILPPRNLKVKVLLSFAGFLTCKVGLGTGVHAL